MQKLKAEKKPDRNESMTKIFEKILIATDGSVKNKSVVKKGLELACEFGSFVCAVYVVDETTFRSVEAGASSGDLYICLKEEGEKALEYVKKIAYEKDVETHLLLGIPARIITDFAEDNDIDLIVVGSRGRSELEKLVLGSVAEDVIRMAKCTVLLVKNDCAGSAEEENALGDLS